MKVNGRMREGFVLVVVIDFGWIWKEVAMKVVEVNSELKRVQSVEDAIMYSSEDEGWWRKGTGNDVFLKLTSWIFWLRWGGYVCPFGLRNFGEKIAPLWQAFWLVW